MSYDDPAARDARILVAMNLADYMMASGLSQTELAKKIGVAQNTLSYYLSAKRYPRPEILKAMADALGVTVADLTSGEMEDGVKKADPPAEYSKLTPEQRRLVDQLIIQLARGNYPVD